jgi:hypothetical protein
MLLGAPLPCFTAPILLSEREIHKIISSSHTVSSETSHWSELLLSSEAVGSQPRLPEYFMAKQFITSSRSYAKDLSGLCFSASGLENKILHVKLDPRPG